MMRAQLLETAGDGYAVHLVAQVVIVVLKLVILLRQQL